MKIKFWGRKPSQHQRLALLPLLLCGALVFITYQPASFAAEFNEAARLSRALQIHKNVSRNFRGIQLEKKPLFFPQVSPIATRTSRVKCKPKYNQHIELVGALFCVTQKPAQHARPASRVTVSFKPGADHNAELQRAIDKIKPHLGNVDIALSHWMFQAAKELVNSRHQRNVHPPLAENLSGIAQALVEQHLHTQLTQLNQIIEGHRFQAVQAN